MAGKEDKRLVALKEYMNHMEEIMNRWHSMMHDLYMKISALLFTLSVAAIGFSASHILDDRYHSGKYETNLACIALICLVVGIFLLIGSCWYGFKHLRNNLQFIQCTTEDFAERYKVAADMYYKYPADTHTNEEKKTSECKYPPSWPWHLQIRLFFWGITLLICWVGFDFFVTG